MKGIELMRHECGGVKVGSPRAMETGVEEELCARGRASPRGRRKKRTLNGNCKSKNSLM